MTSRKVLFSILLLLQFAVAHAQETTVFTEANVAYKRGIELFQQGVYGLSQKEFRSAINLLRPVNEPEWKSVKTDAELHFAKAAVRLGQPEAEKLVLDFLRENSPSPVASQAALEIGDYYFDQKKYDEALVYYNMAPVGSMSGDLKNEIRFKQGYSYFITKKFAQAKTAFAGIKENQRSEWYHPANYYFGCIAFFEKNYDSAISAFKRCEDSQKFKDQVPYFLTQIYFAQKKYDQVISYAQPKAANAPKNKAEMHQLVGQAYFEKGDYTAALPYLEYAANNLSTFRPADYYQLGYTQYQAKKYKNAIENFEQLTKQDSVLGQNGLYHLGDCYVKTGNKLAARTAFGQAASMNYDKTVREDALFNFAKLSYELKYDRDAIEALQKFGPESKYHDDAQSLMGELFENTRDYDRAIATLESMKSRNQKLNEAYQKVTFLRGLQLYQQKQPNEAKSYFNKSLAYPIDKETVCKSNFWLGSIAHENSDLNGSKSYLSTFLAQAKNYPRLPDESSVHMGNYIQGYNFLKEKDFSSAQNHFAATVDGIKRNSSTLYSAQVKTEVLGDAVLRTGDCLFKKNKYKDALKYYDEAVSKKYQGFEYALYQKAIIKGLLGDPVGKINDLDDLVEKYPSSRFTDEALYQLGLTYLNLEKYDQATPPLRRIVSDFKGKSTLVNQALLKLGLIAYNQGSPQTAINYYKQVFANNPENSEAKDALAALEEIYVKDLGQPDEYFAFLETIPGYKVDNAQKENATFEAAESQFQQKKYSAAISGYTAYLTKYPKGANSLTALYRRAECYASNELKQFEKALVDYTAVVGRGQSTFYPKAAEKATLLAFNEEKDYQQAYEMAKKWEDGATSDFSRLDAQVMAIRSALQLNNSVAVYEYGKKITESPRATPEQVSAANFYVGKIAYEKSDFTRAQPALQSAVKNVQGELKAEAYHLLVQILYKNKRYDEAEDMISTANQESAGYDDWIAKNLILLSDVYVGKGDRDSARAALEAVLENYKGSNKQITDSAKAKYAALGGTNSKAVRDSGVKSNLIEVDDSGN